MDVSPYLTAIQTLNGVTPGEKYKDLHSIATKIIENDEEKNVFVNNGQTNRVPAALHSILRILVGLKLKSKDSVVEALKSDDVTIIKLALGAKWFFNASNDLINVDYFSEKLLPYVSLRTRLELIKTLSRFLQAQQAESFHRRFILLFGNDQALPLLVACGEDYVYSEILTNKILLSDRILKELYRKHPNLIIRYLRFLAKDAGKTWSKKGRSNISIVNYQAFLPYLVKNHTKEFVEFFLSIPTYRRNFMKLGTTRAEFFLRNAVDILVERPEDFLSLLPSKLVKSRLSKQQYETMLRNLFPKDFKEFNLYQTCNYVNMYYPEEGRFELFRKNYMEAYGKDLLDHKELFDCKNVLEILPPEITAESSRKILNAVVDKSKYWSLVHQLPPKESVPLLKTQINKSTVLLRDECLDYMLKSCDLYRSKEDLLEVLQYYNTRHKNEQAPVLIGWLQSLSRTFNNMESLGKEHWQVIKDIVQRAYVKRDLFAPNCYFAAQNLFNPMLRFFLKQCYSNDAEDADKVFLDKIVNIILEYYCEHNNKWDFIVDSPELEEMCLEKFLVTVSQKYPETHAVWKKHDIKLTLTFYFIEKLGKFNEKNLRAPFNPNVKATKLLIQYYPWLAKFAAELFINKEENNKSKGYFAFKKSLRQYCPEFYQNLIDENPHMINDVTTNDALVILKRDRRQILSKIEDYIADCQRNSTKQSKSTRRFVMSLKWYQDIPIKFVDKCLAEIEETGSILILGILLEGKILSKIIEPYLPTESQLEIDSENAQKNYELVSLIPRALNFTNPPPELQVLIPLCKGDYLSVALQTLSSIAQRVPIDKVLSFADRLTNNAISVKKAGIRLVFQVSPKPLAREFLMKIGKEEKNPGIREVIAKMIYELFTKSPSPDSWLLMKQFINDLLPDDTKIFDILKNLKSINADYTADYILEIFKKINSFSDEDLDEKERSTLICSFLNELEDKQVFNKLPENTITDIVVKYLLECSLDFMYDVYLFSDEQKFEGRLTVFMSILSENLKQMTVPAPDKPRLYPVMKKIHDKLADCMVFDHLKKNKNKEMKLRLVTSVLENILVRKDLECFINFNIYQILMDTTDAKSFGEKCGKNIDDLIAIYNNGVIIEHYGRCLNRIIARSFYDNQRFDVIDGLKSHKLHYSVLVGLKLLSTWKVGDYDEKFDKFVEAAKNSDDIIIQALLYNFLREINHYDV